MTNKFKVGDRVVVKDGMESISNRHPLQKGRVYEVSEPLGSDLYLDDNMSKCYEVSRFNPAKQDLAELVRIANEGYKAIETIIVNHFDEVEMFNKVGEFSSLRASDRNNPDVINRELRIKPAPTFQQFSVKNNEWVVNLVGDRLHIGCKHFDAVAFSQILLTLFIHGGEKTIQKYGETYFSFIATRSGIAHDRFLLPWEEATKISDALIKAGIK